LFYNRVTCQSYETDIVSLSVYRLRVLNYLICLRIVLHGESDRVQLATVGSCLNLNRFLTIVTVVFIHTYNVNMDIVCKFDISMTNK
jgi:hypothetical protein